MRVAILRAAGDVRPIDNPGHFAIRSDLFLVVAAAVVGDFEDFVRRASRVGYFA